MRAAWNAEEAEIADEFLAHAAASAPSAKRPPREGRAPRFVELLQQLGRRHHRLPPPADRRPSYTLNHEEVAKALEEGIRFAECLTPVAVEVDRFGHAGARCRLQDGADGSRAVRAAGAHRFWSPPARSPTPCWRARTRSIPARRQLFPGAATRTASRSSRERRCPSRTQADVLMHRAATMAASSASSAICIPSSPAMW